MTLSHLEFENLPLSQWSENVEIKGLEVLILSFNFSFFELIPHGKIITFEILPNFFFNIFTHSGWGSTKISFDQI